MHIFVLVAKLYVRPRPPGGTREIRRLIQVSSPKTCSKTISGDEGWCRRGSGVACFRLPPWKEFSAALVPPRRDGCSSLPCRGVLSFRSEARKASGNEAARVHHAAR